MADRWLWILGMVFGLASLLAACGGGAESPSVSGDAAAAASTETTPTSATTAAATEPVSTSSSSTSVASSSSTTTEAPSSSTPTTEDLPADPTSEGFRSPTGNIHCELTAEQARCSHHGDTPWHAGGALPHWAGGVSFGFTEVGCFTGGFVGFDVAAAGRPKATCGDSLYTAPDETLSYGERTTVGTISCVSQRFGMTCLNSDGNGFRMAMNEIAMLYDRAEGWEATASSTAENVLVPTATTVLDEQTKVGTESGSALCLLTNFGFLEPPLAFSECRTGYDSVTYIGDDWSPEGRSCAGADFHGFYLDDDFRTEVPRTATFGCVTDFSPLSNPSVPARPIPTGEAVATGGITCVSTGPAIACYDAEGNGMLTAGDEVSFFYGRGI